MSAPLSERMEAGRELDALVAEHVFGAFVDGERSSIDPDAADTWITTPAFSTDIAAAWQVVDKVMERAWSFDVYANHESEPCVTFMDADASGEVVATAQGRTVSHAICLAALQHRVAVPPEGETRA